MPSPSPLETPPRTSRASRWLAGALVRFRLPLLLLGLALATLAIWPANRLGFDRSIENMFAPDDPVLVSYDRIKRTFGGNEVVLVAYVDPELLTAAGRERLGRVTQAAAQSPGVEQATSLASIPLPLQAVLGSGIYDLFEGYLVSEDRQTAAVICTLEPEGEAPVPRRRVIEELRQAVQAEQPEAVLAGAPLMVVDGFRYIEEDGVLLGLASTCLLIAVIGFCFRSLRWVILPMVVVHLTLVFTKAALVLLQWRLSMVSSMLWAIVTVINVATLMHVVVRFRDLRDAGRPPVPALRETLAEMASPVTWTVITDALGFAALLFAEVGPVQDFGRMMALGSMMSLVTLALFVPGLTLLWPSLGVDPGRAWGEGRLERLLAAMAHGVRRRPKSLIAAIALVAALCAAGISRLRIESDFTSNFRSHTDIVQAYQFVETHLGGAGVWDVMAPVPEGLVADANETEAALAPPAEDASPAAWDSFVARARKLNRALREIRVAETDDSLLDLNGQDETQTARLTKVLSLIDVYDKTELLLLVEGYRTSQHPFQALLTQMREQQPELLSTLWARDPTTGRTYYRVMLRSRERQSSDLKKKLIAAVRQVLRQHGDEPTAARDDLATAADPRAATSVPVASVTRAEDRAQDNRPSTKDQPPPGGKAVATGFYVLLTNLIDSLLADQWITFGIATLAIGLAMCLALRSVKLALVALVPNILPILVITGLLGWFGFRLNMGAAMIAAVSIGLSVDSSIHYLCEYGRRRRAGESVSRAIDHVQNGVGRAMVFSTLALIAGFSALMLSKFVPTVYFGALVGLSMLGGLLGNLIFLPLLLTLTERDRVEHPRP